MKLAVAALALTFGACSRWKEPPLRVMSVCELSRDFSKYRGQVIAVRGIDFYGLRQGCGGKCAVGLWPSFVDYSGGATDEVWSEIATLEKEAARRTALGEHVELWVTIVGKLNAREHRSPLGPCDPVALGGYGHLGGYPAELKVREFRDFEIHVHPHSDYDYNSRPGPR